MAGNLDISTAFGSVVTVRDAYTIKHNDSIALYLHAGSGEKPDQGVRRARHPKTEPRASGGSDAFSCFIHSQRHRMKHGWV
jgi:hypothetical protein